MSTKKPTKITRKTIWYNYINSTVVSWFQKIIIFIIFSLIINHLASRNSFPYSESYRFPIEGFVSSIVLCILISIIAALNFKFYKKKYFSKKIEKRNIVWFMTSTLGYITIMYIFLSIISNLILGGQTVFYYLVIGLLITLLLSFTIIGSSYAKDIYHLYKLSLKDAEIRIENGSKITKLTYENIACFYSENKIVYAVRKDGTTITTNFTLNELEEKINDQLFYRANRQIIIHKEAVDQIEKIENGKLRIRLKASIENNAIAEINISRYKRQEFMHWFK